MARGWRGGRGEKGVSGAATWCSLSHSPAIHQLFRFQRPSLDLANDQRNPNSPIIWRNFQEGVVGGVGGIFRESVESVESVEMC